MWRTFTLLIPALMPSWRFFAWVAPSPRIEYCLLSNPQHKPHAWRPYQAEIPYVSIGSMIRRLFWNPDHNDDLFMVSCAERLMETPTQHSHNQILNRLRVNATVLGQDPDAYLRFRLVFVSKSDHQIRRDVTFVSGVHPVSNGHCDGL